MAGHEIFDPLSIAGRWWSWIEKERQKAQPRLRIGEKSKAWYKGTEEYFKREFQDWRGDLVRGNLWQRDYDILHDSLWADDPRFSITSEIEGFEAACAVFEMMVMRAWNETQCFEDMDVAFGQSLHENIAWVKLDFDKHKQLPKISWIPDFVAVDPCCHGIIRRANWLAECAERPLMDVYVDTTFPEEIRNKILNTYIQHNRNQFDPEIKVKLAYIWSKRGAEPWNAQKLTGRRLIVLADKLEDPILETEWPWPFLDPDEFPLYLLRLKRISGEYEGVPIFQLLESLFRHYNWAVSFNLHDAKRVAQKKVLYDKNKIREKIERDKLEDGAHLRIIECHGPADDSVVNTIDFGQGSDVVYRTAQFSKELHDEQSGITDVVRGQPIGGRATAEEVRTTKANAAIVFQGIAKVLDRFSNEVVHAYALAVYYYTPAWSRIVGTDGQLWTKQKDPQTGQLIDVVVSPQEYAELQPFAPIPGKIIRAGVDAYFGAEHAYHWPEYDLDQLKRDFSFKIEAGSARADAMIDEQRNTLAMLQQLGPQYLQAGFIPQWVELVKRFIMSFRPKAPHKLLPPQDIVQKMQEIMLWVGKQNMAARMLGIANKQDTTKETMNLFGANPQQPFGGPQNGEFERNISKRSATGPV